MRCALANWSSEADNEDLETYLRDLATAYAAIAIEVDAEGLRGGGPVGDALRAREAHQKLVAGATADDVAKLLVTR